MRPVTLDGSAHLSQEVIPNVNLRNTMYEMLAACVKD
jgi:hypothetical protein